MLYRTGLRRTIHRFGARDSPREITFVITDSLGDIAVNSSVTQHMRARHPHARLTLVTHRSYLAAAAFNPEYDGAIGYDEVLCRHPPGHQSYADEIRIAKALTPRMDLLFLCQPSAWCDALSADHTMLELQNRLCGVDQATRLMPRLRIPAAADAAAARSRVCNPGKAVFMSRSAFTFGFGPWAQTYAERVARRCLDAGVIVYDNACDPLVRHERCIGAGDLPLDEAVALAARSDAVISMRSGFSDLVAFTDPRRPHYVVYPTGNYRFSKLSWRRWCSLRDMGVTGATEAVADFLTEEDADRQLVATLDWLRRLQMVR